MDYLALFTHQDGDSFDCTYIQKCWPRILETHAAVVTDPNKLFGFFVTFSHRDSSDSMIITPFIFPMNGNCSIIENR
jgi:hypothetical protein